MKQYRPLAGLRVLSFEGWVSLPSATRLLGDLGADVVRVQQPRSGEGNTPEERFAEQADLSINKRALALDLQNEHGREIARQLALQADIVCNNFRPGVMERYGLGQEALRAEKPELIVLQITGYGASGPWAQLPALGPSVEAAGGMNTLIGDPSLPPMRIGGSAYADVASGRYALLGAFAALRHREQTGKGLYIDLSMYEVTVHLLGDRVLGSAASGLRHGRLGNRATNLAPQNIYRCVGRDEWVAISVTSDAEWARLVGVVGDPALAAVAMRTVDGRLGAQDTIDAALEAWTSTRDKFQVALELQAARVPAGPVTRPADTPVDPQYVERGFWQMVPHGSEILGTEGHAHMSLGWKVQGYARSKLRAVKVEPAPDWAVLRDWLGLSDNEIRALAAEGIVRGATKASLKRTAAPEPSRPHWNTAGRVLDLACGPSGQFATLVLAEAGWEVVRVEFAGETAAANPAPNHLLYDYLNRRKRVVTLDPDTADGNRQLEDLVRGSSCLVEDGGPGSLARRKLSFATLKKLNPTIVVTSISPFGLEGPRSGWLANDFIVQCMGGLVWGTGWDGERPIKLPDHQAEYIAGLNAALASAVAILTNEGKSTHIDLSMQEVFTQEWAREIMRYVYQGRPYRRESKGAGRQGFPHTAMAKDGWLYLLATGASWETVALFLGLDGFVQEPWNRAQVREQRWDEMDGAFRAALNRRTKYEWVAGAAEISLQFAPIDDPLDVLQSPQLQARRFFKDAELTSGETVRCPGLPFPLPAPARPNRAGDGAGARAGGERIPAR
ncbi:MAG: hypothetical protein EXR68_06095 [Dehalococcoidia bacterium]|nr:hypothetical protein [Dehalococcoidia bacterium]